MAGVSLTHAANVVSTFAGTVGSPGYTNAIGTAAQFRFMSQNPSAAVVDSLGNLYVADTANNAIRKIDTAGVVTTFAGSATGLSGSANGTGTAASFSGPQGLAIDGQNTLYVADTGNHSIRMISSGAEVSTLAGNPSNIGLRDDIGDAAYFYSPSGVAVDRNGTGGAALRVYVADTLNHVIRAVMIATRQVNSIVGSSTSGLVDDTGLQARFNRPMALVTDSAASVLYVADTYNHCIRKVNLSSKQVVTWAGAGVPAYVDGTGTGAAFSYPMGLTFDAAGNLLVGDTYNQIIRGVTTGPSMVVNSGAATTVAGAWNAQGSIDGLPTAATFRYPTGVAVAADRTYIVDTNNYTVRVIAAVAAPTITTQPISATVAINGSVSFTVVATGSPLPTYQWQRSKDNGATWAALSNGTDGIAGVTTSQLLLTGVAAAMDRQQFRVVVTSTGGNVTSSAVTLSVTQLPSITNTVTSYTATVGQAFTSFTITTAGSPVPGLSVTSGALPSFVSFTVDSATGIATVAGTRVPDSGDLAGSPYGFAVTATNTQGSSTSVLFTITVQNGPAITTQPADQAITLGQNATFSVVASSSPAVSGYAWQISTDSGIGWSNLSDNALYSGSTSSTLTVLAPTTAMSGYWYRVVVTNSVGTTTSTAARLALSQAPVFTSASSTTFAVGEVGAFLFKATGFPTPSLFISGEPSWATFNALTGSLSGIAPDATIPSYTINVTATNAGGSATQSFTLLVSATPLRPTVTTQPSPQVVGLGQNATFGATATGSGTLTYQWQRYRTGDADYVSLADVGQYSGVATPVLTITGVTAEMNNDYYRVLVTNTIGSTPSNPASLTLSVGTVFTTLAGSATNAGTANGTGADARFSSPTGIATDSAGNLYVADTANHAIRVVSASGLVSTLAGLPGTSGSADGTGTDARFSGPRGIARDSAGNLYVADTGNHIIRMITPAGVVTTIAGTAGAIGAADAVGSKAQFAYPAGLAIDGFGNLYVADTNNNKIRIIASGGGFYNVTSLSLVDKNGVLVTLSGPNGVTVDSGYNVYIADTGANLIRKATASGVTTILAGGGGAGHTDGVGSAALFNSPTALTVDALGTVYVADTANHSIRKIRSAGDVSTIAGKADAPGSTDGGAATARFALPGGIVVDTSNNLYVADTGNHTIRKSGSVTAPVITSQPIAQSARVGTNATFKVVATGSPAPSYQWQRQAVGTTGFVNLNEGTSYMGVNLATLTVVNTTQDMSGDQFQVVVNNLVNPSATSTAVALTVLPLEFSPIITTQPASTTVTTGSAASFIVVADASGTISYQWRKDGVPVSGATSATLAISSVQPANAGTYTVVVSNSLGSLISSGATLTVNSSPILVTSIQPQTVISGQSVTFTANIAGGLGITFQWRKNGVAIAGATSSTLVLSNVSSADAALYDVVATNSLGSITTAPALLTVDTTPSVPVVTSQPIGQTAVIGTTVTFSAAASGYPAPTLQWRKNGTAISGATASTLTLSNVQASDATSYDVVFTNVIGTATSQGAALRTIAASYAGTYFGTFGSGLGSFALYVRADNTAVLLGTIPSSSVSLANTNIAVSDAGQFSFTQNMTSSADEYRVADTNEATTFTVTGTIASDGSIAGGLTGGVAATLAGSRVAATGTTQAYAGYYLAGAQTSAGSVLAIASANTQIFVVAQTATATDAGQGTLSSSGSLSIPTGKTAISGTIDASAGTITVAAVSSNSVNGTFTGAKEGVLASQRMADISSRAKVSPGVTAVAGFAISGTDSKLVLIRAVGPTLSGYGITTPLAQPKLTLYNSGRVVIATNTGVSTSTNVAAITYVATRVGAFPLGSSGVDSALLVTLAPGTYTAEVSTANAGSGLALVEVYDASTVTTGQHLSNLSTRAFAQSAENMLIGGLVVPAGAPKRVLIRAVGPGLVPYGITTGYLLQPILELKNGAGVTIASNTGWTTSVDSASILSVTPSVGAFPLTTADSAMIVTLPPGSYSACVSGANGTSGIALVEVYELQ